MRSRVGNAELCFFELAKDNGSGRITAKVIAKCGFDFRKLDPHPAYLHLVVLTAFVLELPITECHNVAGLVVAALNEWIVARRLVA